MLELHQIDVERIGYEDRACASANDIDAVLHYAPGGVIARCWHVRGFCPGVGSQVIDFVCSDCDVSGWMHPLLLQAGRQRGAADDVNASIHVDGIGSPP